MLDLSDSPNLVSIGAGLLAETPSMTVISVSGCHQLSIEAKAFTFPSPSDGRVTVFLLPIQFCFALLIVCMILIRNMTFVLQKSKPVKTMVNLNEKKVRSKIGIVFLIEI